jgi:hypothetical protein
MHLLSPPSVHDPQIHISFNVIIIIICGDELQVMELTIL